MPTPKNYLNLPLRDLIADTSAKTPTPGGGSVSALVGTVACALGRMAVNFTIGKPKYAAHEPQLQAVLAELTRSGEMFAQLAMEDMAAYDLYAESRGKSEDEQQRALVAAAAVPLEIVAVAAAVLERLEAIKGFCNPWLLSDLQAAALITHAVARAAALNVYTNVKQFRSPGDGQQFVDQVTKMLAHCDERLRAIV